MSLGKCKIKTTMRYHNTSTRIPKSGTLTMVKMWVNRIPIPCWRTPKWYSHLEDSSVLQSYTHSYDLRLIL